MDDEPDDHKRGGFTPKQLGTYHYTLEAWIDEFETWRRALVRKAEARQDVAVELQIGAALVSAAASRASSAAAGRLASAAARIGARERTREGARLASVAARIGDGERTKRGCAARAQRSGCAAHGAPSRPQPGDTHIRELRLTVDPPKALFSAWYELFPRSWARSRAATGRSAMSRRFCRTSRGWASTSSTCRRSTRSAAHTARARTTRSTAKPDDPGSPWAIGSPEGGHKPIHPELGTLEDFRRLS